MKYCPTCDQTRPLSSFNREKRRKDGRRWQCRDCAKRAKRDARAAGMEKPRERGSAAALWDRHRMYPSQWETMWREQGGLCYLCSDPLPREGVKVAIDHDHAHCPAHSSCSLCRRGLACAGCNTAIGMLGDSPDRLRLVADRLERAQAIVQALIVSAPQSGTLF